ncbi:uncharacterized protein L3040_005743 [Drepanopeziza brunnea f. sp. 'multigermtubi']|uniref:MICOS complex subunit MIC12 n=1 Tax=Marssonina brunnea f. sp. multigermtubi (strain MB_m1) TaxID=1072389 RepID=K1XPH5_MARBU|nr:uncharacterized protein MBM_07145 [Drepanopeziza brunnea f. sp. 'multigermtubi' MB_m1]EKD14424.1 hypothetical protein MBM_07145 [Drepanopeziza brunnea f. sp. 'multigermtubi' MB_m1]KAJ5041192.1 hypothetical protein L3040_005743 [Drepanopeziza brunnea f. sp. 'multigermtubi']
MGFTTGFTGGVTLTLGIAYLTVIAHERNRRLQGQELRSQAFVLERLLNPEPLPPPQSRDELAREERTTIVEAAKDRWNAEVENAVRWVQRTDFNDVREGMEGAVARLLGGGLQKSREGIEEGERQAGPRFQEAFDESKAVARKGADQAAVGIDRAATKTIQATERVGTGIEKGASKIAAATKEKWAQAGEKAGGIRDAAAAKADRVAANARTGAQDAADAIKHSGGTFDAARGAVGDAVTRGIEKGKEAIGKAQAAVGLAAEKMESKGQSAMLSHSSAVEKALNQRYEQPRFHDKTVEETLAERYIPMDQQDPTQLRGL